MRALAAECLGDGTILTDRGWVAHYLSRAPEMDLEVAARHAANVLEARTGYRAPARPSGDQSSFPKRVEERRPAR